MNPEVVFSSLKASKLDNQTVRLCTAMLLTGSYSASRIKQILVQKIEESFQQSDFFRQVLKTIHEFGLKSGYNRILNLDYMRSEMETSNQIQTRSRQFSFLTPYTQDRLSSFSIVSKYGLAFYSWQIFRMDDFDFSTKEYSISPQLKLNWFEEKSPPPNLIFTEDTKELDDAPVLTPEHQLNDLVWLRPRGLSSRKGSTKNILRSSDEAGLLNFSKVNKSPSKGEDFDLKDLDTENIDALFDFQEQIELEHPFEDKVYQKLKNHDPFPPEVKATVSGTRYDDSLSFFHGLAYISPSLYDKEIIDVSPDRFFSNPPVIIMKVYSGQGVDYELSNLIRSLGRKFNCLPQYLLPEKLASQCHLASPDHSPTKRNKGNLTVLQGVSSMCYVVVDNDPKLLQTLIDHSSEMFKESKHCMSPYLSTNSNALPVLILYGFEQEIEEFKTNNPDVLRKFDRIVALSKTFDVDVLQLQVTQLIVLNQKGSQGFSSKWPQERLVTRELVTLPFIENRLYSIITN